MAKINRYSKDSVTVNMPIGHSFEDPKSVIINIRMDRVYSEIISEINPTDEDEKKFKAFCQLYILSGGLIEAWANAVLQKIFSDGKLENGIDENMIALIERNKIDDKIHYILSKANIEIRLEKNNLKKIKGIIELRNRLMHFKDMPVEYTNRSHISRNVLHIASSSFLCLLLTLAA